MSENNTPANGQVSSGAHTSFWTDSEPTIMYAPLTQHATTDVVVVGGGIAGLTVAYCLLKAGKQVILVEDGHIGSGETGRTTAHLANALDDRFYELDKVFGEDITKLAAESHGSAIDFIENTCLVENIECDFKRVDGYLFLDPSDQAESLEKEYISAKRAGLQVEKVLSVPGMIFQPGPSLKFSNQAQFHPMKYLKGLCEAVIRKGGKIYTDTRAQEVSGSGIVTADGVKILADYVVVATNAPINSKYILPMRQFAYRSYVIGALVEKSKLPEVLWWDTGNYDMDADNPPYHYVRTEPYNETHHLLICGGEDHAVALADAENMVEEKRYNSLETWARQYFPMGEVIYRWSGQIMEPIDLLGYIGKTPADPNSNIYIVTGDSGHGLTHGTIAGILLTDMMTGKENPWEKVYNPSRMNIIKKAIAWMKEFSVGFLDYLATKPTDTDASKIQELKQDEGTIIKLEGTHYGAYRDKNNQLHLVDAKCTHMGCIVKWNNDEKSWDCPCHGSRFSYNGTVLNGPANEPLDYHKDNHMKFE